jgi:hypothetical protein
LINQGTSCHRSCRDAAAVHERCATYHVPGCVPEAPLHRADRKTGARGLRSIMEGILLDTMFDLPSLEGVEEVVISKEVCCRSPMRSLPRRIGDTIAFCASSPSRAA